MATRMQQRRGTATQWSTANPILNAGEIGWESDNNKFKIGDGINHWADLNYFVDGAELSNIIDGAPALLDTLNELAAAIGDDPAFFTTVATNLSNHQSDTTNIHGITDTAELATKTFAAELLTNATKSNITITGNKNGLTITAENGVADSTTDNLTEGSTNKYFTDERAQDAIGNAVGTGLTYTDSTGEIKVTPNTYDAYGSASTVAGDLSTHASDTTTHGTTGDIVGTSDTQTLTNKTLTSPKINEDVVLSATATELNTLDGITASTAELNILDGVTATASEINTLDGITASTAELNILDGATLSTTELNYVDGVTSSIQDQLDDKAPLASPTFTGTATVDDLEIGGSLTFSGTATEISSTNTVIEDPLIYLADGNPGNINDLGFVANYNDGTYAHTGLVKDASAGAWKLFKGVTDEPTNTVNFAQGSLDDLQVGGLTATSITVGDVSNTEFGYLNGVTSAIQTQIDAKAPSNSPTLVTPNIGVATATSVNGTTIPSSKTLVVTTDKLNVHASTSSSELAGIISDETGSGSLVFNTSPTLKGNVVVQSAGGAGGSANYLSTNNSTGAFSVVSGYPLNLTASGDVTITATGGAAKVGSDTIATLTATQTLTGKTINGADNTLTVRLANDVSGTLPLTNGGTGATTQAGAANAVLPSQSSANGKYLTSDGTNVSWGTVSSYSAPTLGSTSISSGATVTTITGLTLSNATLTVTLTAASSAGTSGQVLSSTGTGVQWITPAQGAAFSELMLVGC